MKAGHTGKSFSDALIVALTNPQYDKRLLMELPRKLQAQNISRKWAEQNPVLNGKPITAGF